MTTEALRALPGRYRDVPDVGSIPGLYYDASPTPDGFTASDGEPWRKCCEECAYWDKRQHEPIERACREQGAAFYCVHREADGGQSRVCAGFATRDRRVPSAQPCPASSSEVET